MRSERLFLEILDRGLADARVRFELPSGARVVGRGSEQPRLGVRVSDPRFFTRALAYGNLGLGEAWMDGDFEMTEGCLSELLTVLLRNRLDRYIKGDKRLLAQVALIRAGNLLRGAWKNVQSHYDAGDDLFESFLDSSLAYSCGYAKEPGDDLERLQWNKFDRICRKLRLARDQRLLDIGCGFGGLLIHAAREHGVRGTGITNSRRHCERARANVAAAGLGDRITIELRDHASLDPERERYDRVVSVGMIEHLSRAEYRRYFRNIARVLTPGGLGLVHGIGCNAVRNDHDPFIQKYIFPGSGQPRLSEIASQLERRGLAILDVENIVRHYAYTVKEWLRRFRENRAKLDQRRYGPVFQRMWEYYLACGIAAAWASDSAVYQVLFTNDYAAELPLQRV